MSYTLGLIAGIAGTPGCINGFSSSSTFDSPFGVIIDSRGSLIVADGRNHVLRRIVRDATFEIEYLHVRIQYTTQCARCIYARDIGWTGEFA